MIEINGHAFGEITDPIYINGKRVLRVYANGEQVYPGADHVEVQSVAMYFGLSGDIISAYSDTPVNEYGAYAYFSRNISSVYRAAFVLQSDGKGSYLRALFVTFRHYLNEGSVTYVPYVAKDGVIIADGLSHPGINVFPLTSQYEGTKYYYYNNQMIGVYLADKDGNLLTDFSISTLTKNVMIFSTREEAKDYVLS